jgi:hypothetical protein
MLGMRGIKGIDHWLGIQVLGNLKFEAGEFCTEGIAEP